jgi:glycosyltransferase involved in cell wall biosynthesis
VLHRITPLIITYNEASNLRRTLAKLTWARRIVVIDSGSTDETLDILADYPNVWVIHHVFSDFASQCNYGLTNVDSEWVLSLDADYELSDELIANLHTLAPSDRVHGYRVRFVYRIFGRPLRGTIYPPRTVLYRKDKARYRNEGHGHRVIVEENVMELKGVIYHDDRKPLMRWVASQQRYVREEVNYLLNASHTMLSTSDKIRLIGWPAPILVFFYTLFAKGCIFGGWAGWYYVLQRCITEMLVALEILDRRLRNKNDQRD